MSETVTPNSDSERGLPQVVEGSDVSSESFYPTEGTERLLLDDEDMRGYDAALAAKQQERRVMAEQSLWRESHGGAATLAVSGLMAEARRQAGARRGGLPPTKRSH
jgi:hypothetical protein